MIHYKIRHRVTGKYSKGGAYVSANGIGSFWSSRDGKVWNTLGKLRSHITSHMPNYSGDQATDMRDWQVVEYTVVEGATRELSEVIDPKKLLNLLKM